MKQRLNCWASSYKAFPSFSRHLATRAEREAWTPTPTAHAPTGTHFWLAGAP
jgi:hypothetical protein